eukprot:NODE_4891_length_754_cov_35.687943_g4091_i0.p1 GENE.NODE_4891_length_754_cov_35.687943_g4091_i0~~NODE_4891_length_754_cov_35.687943_g4091_i0.p1  ORF type:complete len:196 (+),score=58.59 NODE_4891_length_754_cov_35.687943_g4091_i0:72-659(+)
MPFFERKRLIKFPREPQVALGILPASWRVDPIKHILIRDPKYGIEKNLIAEAKKNGTYESTILNMPANDTRHPYYSEYLWVTYSTADYASLTPAQKWQAWQARLFRHSNVWPSYGLLFDDVAWINQHAVTREAIRRLPTEVRVAREKRVQLAQELRMQGRTLAPEEQPPAHVDVSYLLPYIRMVQDEWNEAHSFV